MAWYHSDHRQQTTTRNMRDSGLTPRVSHLPMRFSVLLVSVFNVRSAATENKLYISHTIITRNEISKILKLNVVNMHQLGLREYL